MAEQEEAKVGRPLKYKTVKELQIAVETYFEEDAMVDMGEYIAFQPTMSGLARSLGLSRQSLLNYESRDEFLDTIKDARLRVEEALEGRLYGNSPTGAIFNLKNNFGWKDAKEVDNKSTDGSMTPKAASAEEIANAVKSIAENL